MSTFFVENAKPVDIVVQAQDDSVSEQDNYRTDSKEPNSPSEWN